MEFSADLYGIHFLDIERRVKHPFYIKKGSLRHAFAMPVRKPSDLDKELGAYLKRLMREREWSYPQLSKKTGVPLSMLHGLVAGQQSTSLHMLTRILKNLGVGLREIFPNKID